MKARIIALVAIVLVAVLGSVGFVLHQKSEHQAAMDKAPKPTTVDLASLQQKPRIVFRNTSLGNYGRIAMVALNDPSGPRAIASPVCDRVYSSAERVLCLSSKISVVTTYTSRILKPDFTVERALFLAGSPSRARLSADGRLAATTSFTAGDSYLATGFSTRTVITDLTSGITRNLEDMALLKDGKRIKPTDRNFWGVTFAADDNRFYATVAFAKHTYLVRGDLAGETLTVLTEDAECPSLSPDGTTIVYKKRKDQGVGRWRLARYDVATGKEAWLSETRSVDDQVEWLDNSHVLYGIPRGGSQAANDDVYSAAVDGTTAPVLLIENAWSPAVVR